MTRCPMCGYASDWAGCNTCNVTIDRNQHGDALIARARNPRHGALQVVYQRCATYRLHDDTPGRAQPQIGHRTGYQQAHNTRGAA